MSAVIQLTPDSEHEEVGKAGKYYAAGDYAKAGAVAELYLREHPEDAQALAILAACLKQGDKSAIAYTLAKRATELRPDRPETWVCLGHMAQNLWRMDEANDCYRKALQRVQRPAQKGLYNNNLGSVQLDLGQFEKAEVFIDESLKYEPNDKNARHNKGLCLLARREWEEGWKFYSASIGSSYRSEFKYKPAPGEPTWDGTPVNTLIVFGEQGLGDEVCAASALPDVIARQAAGGGRVIIDCDKRLEGLFKRSFPEATVYGTRWDKVLNWQEADRNADASISAFEVLKHFRNKAEDFPGKPYLVPCPTRTAMWKKRFANGKPTIGIAWTGGTWKNAGSFRKLPLAEWQPLFDAVDANWVSLQYKDASADIAGTPVVQHNATLSKDYDDTAALVASCDLVIAMQTSVNHLAGALGVPTWIILPKTSQWRYGESYTDLPWYSCAKLYRQGATWPMQTIAADLKAFFK
jgi:tetratricopeptide (TPR) repeat protein